ncbi:MAG: hypothetical protein H6755_01970 [Candidatus Omnitrophica bacterium]|nr:hypothetical protein [Candidatus Omnitrophota bacterium]MCB9747155.1 hypothetical protein [Candidatus Omnitrophota bacterium]
MINVPISLFFIISTSAVIILFVLAYFLIAKSEQITSLQNSFIKLRNSFNDLDEQAKLIVKTDLELNKAQEESEKRLHDLDNLQKISRLISTTLEENELFLRLENTLKTNVNYEKTLILLTHETGELNKKISLGFTPDEVTLILTNLQKDLSLMDSLKNGKSITSINAARIKKTALNELFHVNHFIISPILSQTSVVGLYFVGNKSNASPITEGDEELISVLANQIGQSLENARLFEQVYRSSQQLEKKVQERTQQLEKALTEVQNISKTKSEFISSVSHELRTPLTSIKGYAAILMSGKLGEIPLSVKERLQKINTHSDNLVNLINDLLDISRIESGKAEMNIATCNIKKIIDNVADLLTPQMKDKKINWVAKVSADIPEMHLDSSQVDRVFINLISNAIKFTPENGTISVEALLEDNHVNFSVSDTGIGIEKNDIDRLFDEFFRVENKINQNVKGTGLGLALVKKIVEAHRGKIWITSEINKGSTFNFTLPIEHNPEKV